MPNNLSAKKRLRQAAKSQIRNLATKRRIKSETKKANEEPTTESVAQAISVIDRAAAKGVIHKNAAARRKSRLAKQLAE